MGRATAVQSLVDAGAQPVYGDLKESASLATAVADIDTVITTATASQRQPPDSIETVDLQGTLALINAAQEAGVRHFIYTSGLGRSDPEHPVPLIDAKRRCEEALRQSRMNWTILQPHMFMDIWFGIVIGMPLQMQQPITLVVDATHRHAFMAETDVAAFAVRSIDNPLAHNRVLLLGGPESYSWSDIVAMVEKALDTALPVNYVPLGSQVPLMPPPISDMMNSLETFDTAVDMSTIAPEFGITLTPAAVMVNQMFGAPLTV